MQEPALGEPAFIFDQLLMEDGDLTGWAAKAHESKLEPEPEGRHEGNRLSGPMRNRIVDWIANVAGFHVARGYQYTDPMIEAKPSFAARAILCLLALLSASGSAWSLPANFTANYEVSRYMFSRFHTLGEAELALTREGAGYRYVSHTRPIPIIALFYGEDVMEMSRGQIVGGAVRPDRYDYELKGRNGHSDYLVFQHDKGEVEQNFKGKTVRQHVPPETLDRLSMQLAIMRELATGDREMQFLVADRRRLYAYRFEVTGNERISTPFGEFDTVKVELTGQQRIKDSTVPDVEDLDIPDEDDRRTIFWCAPALDYIPIRVEYVDRDQGQFRMSIRSLDRAR